jgi:hypothetical protein
MKPAKVVLGTGHPDLRAGRDDDTQGFPGGILRGTGPGERDAGKNDRDDGY